jgi:hypothetical protein
MRWWDYLIPNICVGAYYTVYFATPRKYGGDG